MVVNSDFIQGYGAGKAAGLPQKVAESVTDWLEENVDPDSGYVIDKSLTVENAAADAKKVGDEVDALKGAFDSLIDNGLSEDGNYYNDSLKVLNTGITTAYGEIVDEPGSAISQKISMDFTKTIIARGSTYSSDNNYLYCYGSDGTFYGRVACKDGAIVKNTYANTAYVVFPSKMTDTNLVVRYGTNGTYIEYNPVEKYIENSETVNEMKPIISENTEEIGKKADVRFDEFANYFDRDTIVRNETINSGTGIISSYPDWWVSGKIELDFTKKIVISGDAYQGWAYCYTYDTSISGYHSGYYGRVQCNNGEIIANTYPNTEYIRIIGSDAGGYNAVVGYGDIGQGYTEFNPVEYVSKVITDNKEAEATMTAISYSDTKQTGNTLYRNHYLTLVHFSDIHGNAKASRDAIAYANRFKNIDAVLNTGDAQNSNYFTNYETGGFADTLKPYILRSAKPCLYVIGNHDCGNHFTAPCTDQDVYDYYIKDIKDQMGVTIGSNKNYYFKDFTSQKIRLIVLNEYDNPRTMNGDNYLFDQWNRFFSQDQVTWLCNVLSSTTRNPSTGLPDDYSVVIALHQWVYDLDINTLNSSFSYPKAIVGWKANAGCYKSNQDNTLLRNIVDAFISKTTLSKTYDVDHDTYSYLPTGTYTVTVNADFSDRTNSNFICFLSGHAHMDCVGYVKGMTNTAINIVITTDCIGSNDDDLPRVSGTKSENTFNIIAFDTDTKNIKLCRIGADMTYDLTPRKYEKISYDFSQ